MSHGFSVSHGIEKDAWKQDGLLHLGLEEVTAAAGMHLEMK